jgi:hypothetical protein
LGGMRLMKEFVDKSGVLNKLASLDLPVANRSAAVSSRQGLHG